MSDEKGFSVNNFDHLEAAQDEGLEARREASGWGIVREDLEKHHVQLLTDVRLIYPDDTPPEMRQKFAEASFVLHHIAEQAIMRQLEWDKLKPTQTRNLVYGDSLETGEKVVIRDSGWLPFED